MSNLEDYVTTIPDFPKPGIMFRDVTSIVNDETGFKLAIDLLVKEADGMNADIIMGSESRGFVFGCPVAYALNK